VTYTHSSSSSSSQLYDHNAAVVCYLIVRNEQQLLQVNQRFEDLFMDQKEIDYLVKGVGTIPLVIMSR